MRTNMFGRAVAPVAAIAAAIFAFGVGLSVAQAEDAKPADAKPATTTTPSTPKTAEKTAAAPSPCKGLDETACKASSECTWYKEVHIKKTGKTRKAHCQKKRTPPKKKT